MTGPFAFRYHPDVPAPRSAARTWIAAGALLLGAVFGWPRDARAATTSYDVSDGAIVQVVGRGATIAIRTWNRDTVQIEWPDGEAFAASKAVQRTGPRLSFLIPNVPVQEAQAEGWVAAALPPEDFPVQLPPGDHDVVRIVERVPPGDGGKPPPATHLTVMIPESTGLVNVRSGRGPVTLSDYHGTTIANVGRGRIVFDNVSGDAFVQPLNGHFYATGSTFDRLRIRSNRADEVFDACRVKQIEATTLTGNIVFDNGVFDPGLARFESDRGSIALGVNGGAQLGAHTEDGQVLTVLPPVPSLPDFYRDDGETLDLAGGGGPLVNAMSRHGNVYLYDGSLADRRPAELEPPWRPIYNHLVSARAGARHPAAGAEVPLRPRERPLNRTGPFGPRTPQFERRRTTERSPERWH
jgi:hypothetical protein